MVLFLYFFTSLLMLYKSFNVQLNAKDMNWCKKAIISCSFHHIICSLFSPTLISFSLFLSYLIFSFASLSLFPYLTFDSRTLLPFGWHHWNVSRTITLAFNECLMGTFSVCIYSQKQNWTEKIWQTRNWNKRMREKNWDRQKELVYEVRRRNQVPSHQPHISYILHISSIERIWNAKIHNSGQMWINPRRCEKCFERYVDVCSVFGVPDFFFVRCDHTVKICEMGEIVHGIRYRGRNQEKNKKLNRNR